jgi:hypothetical protein
MIERISARRATILAALFAAVGGTTALSAEEHRLMQAMNQSSNRLSE